MVRDRVGRVDERQRPLVVTVWSLAPHPSMRLGQPLHRRASLCVAVSRLSSATSLPCWAVLRRGCALRYQPRKKMRAHSDRVANAATPTSIAGARPVDGTGGTGGTGTAAQEKRVGEADIPAVRFATRRGQHSQGWLRKRGYPGGSSLLMGGSRLETICRVGSTQPATLGSGCPGIWNVSP